MFDKQWIFNIEQHNRYLSECRAQGKTPSFIDEIFFKRGFRGAPGGLDDLSDPYVLPDMDRAVDRILAAAEEGERVAVFGDYDADGVTASAVLYHFFKNFLEMDVLCHIPDRLSEGYGMSCGAVDRLAEENVTLIVTVDNGIVAFEEIAHAAALGIDVVVTDHHKCADRLPECSAVVDPCILTEKTPASDLCGAGVAYALIRAIADVLGLSDEIRRYVPLVTVGTLGDAVALTGDNRILVKYGMEHLTKLGWTGLNMLVDKISGGKEGKITSTFILFYLVPKLNAAGRLGNADRAFRLLISENAEEAASLTEELISENTKRQAAEAEITQQAMQPENLVTGEDDAVVVALGTDWHPGVIGIVASRLTEKYGKPSFVLVKDSEDTAKGSARSVKGFDLHKALSGCAGLLERFGGHEMAAGLGIRLENLRPFIDSLNKYGAEHSQYITEPPNLEIDAVVLPEELTVETVSQISELEPYGTGNPQPLLCVRRLRIHHCTKVGETGKHLKLSFSGEAADGRKLMLDGIAFSQSGYEAIVRRIGCLCSVVCRAELNEWMGKRSVSLLISDLHDADYDIDNGLKCVYNSDYITGRGFALERRLLAVMYKQLLAYGDSFKFSDLYRIRENMRKLGLECTWYEIRNAIDIFTELELIKRKDKQNFSIVKRPGKTELGASAVYCRAQVQG